MWFHVDGIISVMLKSQSKQQSTNNILGMNLDGERVLLVYGSLTGSVYETMAAPMRRAKVKPINTAGISKMPCGKIKLPTNTQGL